MWTAWKPRLWVGFQVREAVGPGGCFFFPGCCSDSHKCLLGTLCLKGFGLSSEMYFLKSRSKSSKCEGEGYCEGQQGDPIRGWYQSLCHWLARGLGRILLPHRCLCVLSAKQGGFQGSWDAQSPWPSCCYLGRGFEPVLERAYCGRYIRESLLAALTPCFHSSESNLKLTASLCSESKAFYLPFHSQMPFRPL
ncbi:unnamed protein product [Rangifer tarandus platyrhynchus]|uniref:Uncharacterized protein n=1 Tax=Rangifer tarandus platyrhynchus TaxID=3082113 RepID=A0ABN8YH50_RANTA|nr:unnamed protein product [Rangifer tarandus platyrhynchus]